MFSHTSSQVAVNEMVSLIKYSDSREDTKMNMAESPGPRMTLTCLRYDDTTEPNRMAFQNCVRKLLNVCESVECKFRNYVEEEWLSRMSDVSQAFSLP